MFNEARKQLTKDIVALSHIHSTWFFIGLMLICIGSLIFLSAENTRLKKSYNDLIPETVVLEEQRTSRVPGIAEIQLLINLHLPVEDRIDADGIMGPETLEAWNRVVCEQYAQELFYD